MAMETVRKKSSTPLGRGTMIIAMMAIIIPTIVRSFALAMVSRKGIARFRIFERVALANSFALLFQDIFECQVFQKAVYSVL